MTSNYDKIREENILEYGKGTRHLAFLGRLYTDRTHFIFELLQNAEDAGATKILFRLFDDRLEVYHDGRPFNELNVRGICGVGEGTKAEDLTKIGKFGIGFKSVYAYTTRPEIYSGDESFKVDYYVRPYPIIQRPIGELWTTLFVFVFNANGVDANKACQEIGARLQELGVRTLLFLRNINEIEYKLPDETGGIYLREEIARQPAREVTVIGQNNGTDENEKWLIFERSVPVPDSINKVSVEVAFRLITARKDKKEFIEKIGESPLVVFFPTEKDTRFGFLIQGPYRTTPARDNIPKDDEWNKSLVEETACLLSDVLPALKELGLVTVSLLEALPIRMEDFLVGSFFYPVVKSVRETLLNKDLLPADDGTFISAHNAKLARGTDIRNLLSQPQLLVLYQSNDAIKWLAGEITRERTPDLHTYLRTELSIEEITPDSFSRKITESFLINQTDEWFVKFYQFLSGQEALWKPARYNWESGGILRSKPIIRLQTGKNVIPFAGDGSPNAYLTTTLDDNLILPVVKKEIAQDEDALQFLRNLKIPDLDIVEEVIEYIIPKYKNFPVPVSIADHRIDMDKIVKAYETDSQEKKQRLKKALQATPFVLTRNGSDYRKPEEVYDHVEDLEMYFAGNPEVKFLFEEYLESEVKMFLDLGVSNIVRVKKRKPDYLGHVILAYGHGYHERGLDGFDLDVIIDGLGHAMKISTLKKSAYIWNKIAIPNHLCIQGVVESSSRQNYNGSNKSNKVSTFGHLLMDTSWLPDSEGGFKKPTELFPEDLPPEFERNHDLALFLKMKKVPPPQPVKEVEVRPETLEVARQITNDPELFDLMKRELARKNQPTIFDENTVEDPERRRENLKEQLVDAKKKGYEERVRSVRTSKGMIDPSIWLKNKYTDGNGHMFCQICKNEMPFKKRDGEYYFEAVETLPKGYFDQEHEAQYLALCPLCSAKYKEFIKKDNEASEKLSQKIKESGELDVVIKFGNREVYKIHYVESHWLDLKVIMTEND